jgi:iron(III) transport system substrate-binding protein
MTMCRPGIAGLIASLSIVVTGCEKGPETVSNEERKDAVVVYAALEQDAPLRELFVAYSEESGVRVVIRRGIPQSIVTDLIESRVSPPADVLVTRSVTDIWRAAEEGALRPLRSKFVSEGVPQWLRDADDFWAAMSYQTAVLAYDPGVFATANLSGMESLQESQFRGRLCLSSSANPINRAVIAMLIEESGVRDTQAVVRGWMANLAQPVFDTDDELLAAIDAGDCGIGIVSSSTAARASKVDSNVRFRTHEPADITADIEGVGVARHARNPEGAVSLIEWMLGQNSQALHSSNTLFFSSSGDVRTAKAVSLVARHEDEAIKLAERVQYRN